MNESSTKRPKQVANSVPHIAFFARCAVNTVVIWDYPLFYHHGIMEQPLRPPP